MRRILSEARRALNAMKTLREADELLSSFRVALDELPLFRQNAVVAPLVDGVSVDGLIEGVVRRAESGAAASDTEVSVVSRGRVTASPGPWELRRRGLAETPLEIRERDQREDALRPQRFGRAAGAMKGSSVSDDAVAQALLRAGGGTAAAARRLSVTGPPPARAATLVDGAAAEAAGVREEAGGSLAGADRAGVARMRVPGPAGTSAPATADDAADPTADPTPAPLFGERAPEPFAARFRDPVLMAAFHTPLTPSATEEDVAGAAHASVGPRVQSRPEPPAPPADTDEALLQPVVARAEHAARGRAASTMAVEAAEPLAPAALPPVTEGHSSGLRRLAGLATHVERASAPIPLPPVPARDAEDDLATRLADLLRAEARRHGVDTEGLVR